MVDTDGHKLDINNDDSVLIEQILLGSRSALESLIGRYQGWIYNVSLKMTMDHQDAEDITQEILIKLLTKLGTYQAEKGLFRTWLYRIVGNHVLNMKTRKYEKVFFSLEECTAAIDQVPDESIEGSPEQLLMIEELKIKCLTGILICLDRKHRLAFIMSDIFGVPHTEGKEVLETSAANYRKILSRARKKVNSFINQNCGLIDSANPCHCSKKLKGFIRAGFIDPSNMTFYNDQVKSISEAVRMNRGALEQMVTPDKARDIFQHHPYYDPPNLDKQISATLQSTMISKLM